MYLLPYLFMLYIYIPAEGPEATRTVKATAERRRREAQTGEGGGGVATLAWGHIRLLDKTQQTIQILSLTDNTKPQQTIQSP
jgi:hypothetical protein